MEKVRRGEACMAAAVETTTLESMPPLRKAPTGTSAIVVKRTASVTLCRIASIQPSSLRGAVACGVSDQYRLGAAASVRLLTVNAWAGASFSTRLKIERVPQVTPNARY
jgi:hypothetical protein